MVDGRWQMADGRCFLNPRGDGSAERSALDLRGAWNWLGRRHNGGVMPVPFIDIIYETRHRFTVRTTPTLDDDILELAARQAKLRGVSLSRTVSDLLRRGLSAPTASQDKGGIVVFQLPFDSPPVTTEEVRRIEAEGA